MEDWPIFFKKYILLINTIFILCKWNIFTNFRLPLGHIRTTLKQSLHILFLYFDYKEMNYLLFKNCVQVCLYVLFNTILTGDISSPLMIEALVPPKNAQLLHKDKYNCRVFLYRLDKFFNADSGIFLNLCTFFSVWIQLLC